MAKDLTAVRIDGEMIDLLKKISADTTGVYSDRTVSWLIGRAVKEFVERNRTMRNKGKERDAD